MCKLLSNNVLCLMYKQAKVQASGVDEFGADSLEVDPASCYLLRELA